MLFIYSCSNSQSITNKLESGKVKYVWTRHYIDPKNDAKDYFFNVWYLDSTVIIEYKTIVFDMGSSPFKEPAYLRTDKFIYFDLTTNRCQDYKSFNTISPPVSNYQLKPNETLVWDFYTYDTLSIYKGSYQLIADTTIDDNQYKRIYFEKQSPHYTFKRICYLTNNISNNIFHLSRNIDSIFQLLRYVRYEDYLNNKLEAVCYYEQVSSKLSSYEAAVFRKWRLNGIHIKLPLQTKDEVLKSDIRKQ